MLRVISLGRNIGRQPVLSTGLADTEALREEGHDRGRGGWADYGAAPLGHWRKCCVITGRARRFHHWEFRLHRKKPKKNLPELYVNPHWCDHRAPSHFGEVRGEEVSRPATQSNIYFGRKYCRKCRQADVLAPRFHCHRLCTVASAVKVPSYFHNEQGFLDILESFSETEVGQELYRRPWEFSFCGGRIEARVQSLL